MTCKVVKNQISLFLDNRLGQKDAEAFRLHVDSCPACRKEFESMRAALDVFANVERVEPRSGGWDRLQDRLSQPESVKGNGWWASPGWIKALAGSAVAAAVAIVVWQTTLTPQQPVTVNRVTPSQNDTVAVNPPDDNQSTTAPGISPDNSDISGVDIVKPVPEKVANSKTYNVKNAGSRKYNKKPYKLAQQPKPVTSVAPKVVVATSEPDPALAAKTSVDSVGVTSEVAQLVAEGFAPLVDAAEYEDSLYWASTSESEDWL